MSKQATLERRRAARLETERAAAARELRTRRLWRLGAAAAAAAVIVAGANAALPRPRLERAARVAAGAERQNRLWAFLEAFYARQGSENSGYVTDALLRDVSKAAGVDAGSALGQADSAFATARLRRADADATRIGVTGTPTLTVRRGSGPERVLAASPLDAAAVQAELDRKAAR